MPPYLAPYQFIARLGWQRCLFGCVVLSLFGTGPSFAESVPSKLTITSPLIRDNTLTVRGRDSNVQILVNTQRDDGKLDDVTRSVKYSCEPAGLVDVTSDGLISPRTEGQGILRVEQGGGSGRIALRVERLKDDLPLNFSNEIVPIFTKYGCNGGGCHGKSGGQNGFRLSLLGFEPLEDYEYLVQDAHLRRISPAAPDRSLLLRKATGAVPHGGGARIPENSPAYRLLRRWIQQGLPYGHEDDPIVDRIEITPKNRLLQPEEQQQLSVVAHYSDGSMADVTRMTHLESNDPDLAGITETGLLSAGQRTGRVAVMARFQSHVDVMTATIPLGESELTLPPERNLVDRFVFSNLKQLGLPASPLAEDSTFLRRATIDIAGRLPTLEETERYLRDDAPDKRDRLVDRLLDSGDYADYFAKKWSAILRNKRSSNEEKPLTFAFHDWLRSEIKRNHPYDQIVRSILAAAGPVETTPAVAWYHEVRDVESQVEDAAQLFMGMRIQCARCHHHPQERWSQADYYGLTAFFSRVGRKTTKANSRFFHVLHRPGRAIAKHPKSGEQLSPKPLSAEPLDIPPLEDPRHHFVNWLADPDNPFFARALANRYWKHFLGRGLVEPEDDMRVSNPPSNPQLLDGMAEYFVASGFDLKALVRLICTSNTYALSALPNAFNVQDEQNHSRFMPRRLSAEVLADSIDNITGQATRYSGMPANTRAVQLPDNAFDSYFLTLFGRPESESACECERSEEVSLAQTLHLINSKNIYDKIGNGRAKQFETDDRANAAHLRELYMTVFSRPPTTEELDSATSYLVSKASQRKQAYEDVIWAMLNTKEFLFNH